MTLRRKVLLTLGSAALGGALGPRALAAPPPRKVVRLGLFYLLREKFDPKTDPLERALIEGLHEHGYDLGRNLVIEFRSTGGQAQRLPQIAAEFVGLKVDMIVVRVAVDGVRAAREATSTIPIVMVGVADPVANRLVESLGRPGGNVTGLSINAAEIAAKRVQLLKEAVPRLSTVTILWNSNIRSMSQQYEIIGSAAPVLGLSVRSIRIANPADFERSFTAMEKERPQGLVVLLGPSRGDDLPRLVEFVVRHKIPAIFEQGRGAEGGGLMEFGTDVAAMARRVGSYVDRLANGARPADLPVEEPTKFELVINMKAAREMGLMIPPTLLLRADRVIE